MAIANIIPVIQAAISPAILISGIGLLMQSMSNRLGRIIDRTRKLMELKKAGERTVDAQIKIIWRRARLLRVSITLSAIGALSAAINIILIFLSATFDLKIDMAVIGLFIFGMASVIVALSVYIVEINQSLRAIELELEIQD